MKWFLVYGHWHLANWTFLFWWSTWWFQLSWFEKNVALFGISLMILLFGYFIIIILFLLLLFYFAFVVNTCLFNLFCMAIIYIHTYILIGTSLCFVIVPSAIIKAYLGAPQGSYIGLILYLEHQNYDKKNPKFSP